MEHQIAQYDESIRYVDDQLKRNSEAADRAGRKIRWVITSDHRKNLENVVLGDMHTPSMLNNFISHSFYLERESQKIKIRTATGLATMISRRPLRLGLERPMHSKQMVWISTPSFLEKQVFPVVLFRRDNSV